MRANSAISANLVYKELRLEHSLSEIADKLFLHTGTLKRWEATQKIPNEYLYDLNFLLGNKYDLQKVDFRSHNEFFTKKKWQNTALRAFRTFCKSITLTQMIIFSLSQVAGI